jgi:hypothetical protein
MNDKHSHNRNPHVHELYTPRVEAARQRITADPTLAAIVDPEADPNLVLAFLIHFSALGVEMTRRVEDWIERAGKRCQELGHTQLGRALIMHARHEAGHHTMMIDDLRLLVPRWNQTNALQLDVEQLLALPATTAMQRYDAIHEDTINSETPYGQIAIEYEVEGMSVVLGPALLQACSRALGQEILAEMSFIGEHAALDVGHTAMNEAELEKFLTVNPTDAERLAQIGSEALNIYLDFLGECVNMGRELVHAARTRAATAS